MSDNYETMYKELLEDLNNLIKDWINRPGSSVDESTIERDKLTTELLEVITMREIQE